MMNLGVAAFALALAAGGLLLQSEPAMPPTAARDDLTTATPTSETTDMASPASTEPRRANQLIKATSPYLLQHAHNPVDWHEWGPEALDKARREDKPIFLSIGYAACHWCHVMEHESFESDEVATVLNRAFVSVKVDREERPDIDELYMAYTQATTGHGGWPMSVWLHPDGTPFYAGTYFPKDSFFGVLGRIEELWRSDRGQISQHAGKTREFFEQWAGGDEAGEDVLSREVIERVADTIARHFDRRLGGLASGQNKFPPSMAMDLMLRVHRRTGNRDLLDAVTVTLDHMARGGIYDHVGGGICRYSTDPEWLVPHFEKMLYDQAMVSSVYLDAYLATGNGEYADVARDIFEYVLTDLQSPSGGYYSSRDADSGGFEGAYYIWTVEQVRDALGAPDADLLCKYYDVTETGNWFERFGHAPPGPKNILHVTKPPGEFAKVNGLDESELRAKLVAWRSKLREVRAARTLPPLDDKVLTSWNGLMIASLAKGARALDEPKYAEAAARAARFVLDTMRSPDGRLLRTSRNGESRLTGYLEDYAFFIDGLLNLYEATFDRRWLDEARKLADLSIRFYFDEKDGGFFFTASDGEKLLARSKSPNDGAIPSGNSVHATNLMRLGLTFNDRGFRDKADSIFQAFGASVARSPASFERLACAADFRHDRVKEIVIVGDPAAPGTKALLGATFGRYLPNRVVMHAPVPVADSDLPLLKNKGMRDGKPTAYVCENYGCKLPVTDAEALIRQLEGKEDLPNDGKGPRSTDR